MIVQIVSSLTADVVAAINERDPREFVWLLDGSHATAESACAYHVPYAEGWCVEARPEVINLQAACREEDVA